MVAGVAKGERWRCWATPALTFRGFLATISIGGIWLGSARATNIDEYRYLRWATRNGAVLDRSLEGGMVAPTCGC